MIVLLQKGNSIEGEYHDMMFLTNPMVNMSLVVEAGVQFSPPLDQTKEIMINCLKEIVENTQNFPRIEKEIFPEYKEEDIFLLDVTWEEDYVQQLGQRIFIFMFGSLSVQCRVIWGKISTLFYGIPLIKCIFSRNKIRKVQ